MGQYAVAEVAATGIATYTFAAADQGLGVLLNYSYVPAEIEQAAIEWISERYRYKQRIGQVSQSLGGQETSSYSLKDMPDFIKLILQPYKKVVPL